MKLVSENVCEIINKHFQSGKRQIDKSYSEYLYIVLILTDNSIVLRNRSLIEDAY